MKLVCAILLVLSIGLAACGFQPLYAERDGTSTAHELASVAVSPIDSRMGQLVYGGLIDELAPADNPQELRYRLDLKLHHVKEGQAFEEDAAVTRFSIRLTSKYDLVETATGRTVFSGSSHAMAAYNVVINQYATLTAERNAEKRAARELTENMKLQLSLYFNNVN